MVRELDDLAVLEIGIIENVQRADLNAIEEALSYKVLIEKFGQTQELIAQTVGKSRSHVANTLRLLALPDSVQHYVTSGEMTAGHARAIANVPDPAALAREVIDKGLSVRDAERRPVARRPPTAKPAPSRAAVVRLGPRTPTPRPWKPTCRRCWVSTSRSTIAAGPAP